MYIAHDPGHGPAPGTIHNGITERDYVLEVARDCINWIPWAAQLLLRSDGEGTSYTDRAQAAATAGIQLVFCHHVNAMEPGQPGQGLITFYDPSDDVGREVARVIARAAPARLYRQQYGVIGTSPYAAWDDRVERVMKPYRAYGIPCVLIEWGFASDVGDAEALLDLRMRPAMVAAVACGVARAYELLHSALPDRSFPASL